MPGEPADEYDGEDDPELMEEMKKRPPPECFDEEGNPDEEKLYRYSMKLQKDLAERRRQQGKEARPREPEKNDEESPERKCGDEEFLFEKYLRSGEYLDIKKKKRLWREEGDDEEDLGLDGLVFKQDNKRSKND